MSERLLRTILQTTAPLVPTAAQLPGQVAPYPPVPVEAPEVGTKWSVSFVSIQALATEASAPGDNPSGISCALLLNGFPVVQWDLALLGVQNDLQTQLVWGGGTNLASPVILGQLDQNLALGLAATGPVVNPAIFAGFQLAVGGDILPDDLRF